MGKRLVDDILRWTLEVNGKPAQKELGELEQSTRKLEGTNKDLKVELQKMEANNKKNTQEYKNLQAQITKNNKTIKTNKGRMAGLRKEVGLNGLTARQLRSEYKRLKNQIDNTTPNTPAWKKHQKELNLVKQRMGQVSSGTKRVNTAFGNLKSMIPIIGIAGLIAGLKGLVTNIINVRKEFEKYEAVLGNTLGSEQKARQEMNMLKEFAAETPFQLNELTGSFVKLVNQGFKPSRDEMTKLGDLASSTGKGIDMLAEAVIDAQVGEFERLKELGIRAKKEGDKVTFTFKEQATQVDFTAQSIQEYILSLGEAQGVSGAMEKISGTLGGRISNLGDAWDNLLNSLGSRTSGIFMTVIGWITGFIEKLDMASRSILDIKRQVMDDQSRENLKQGLEEINVMTQSLIKNGRDQVSAQKRAVQLHLQALETRIKGQKELLENATEDEKEHQQTRLDLLIQERSAIEDHFIKLNQIQTNSKTGGVGGSKDALKTLEQENKKRIVLIKQNYADEKLTKEQFQAEMYTEEMTYLVAKRDLLIHNGESAVEIEEKILDKEIEIREKANQIKQAIIDDWLKTVQDNVLKEEKELIESGERELQAYIEKIDAEIEAEERKNEEIREQRDQDFQDMKRDLDRKYGLFTDFAGQAGAALGETMTDSELTMKSFSKQIILIALDTLRNYLRVQIAQATIGSLASAESIATFGAAGVAKAALLTGLMEAAFGAVKGLVTKNMYTGGFTGSGGKFEPAGLVHKEEWVANKELVKDPVTGQIIKALELIRIGKLDKKAFVLPNFQNIINIPQLQSGGYTPGLGGSQISQSQGNINLTTESDPELKVMISENTKVIQELFFEIKKGIKAKTVISEHEEIRDEYLGFQDEIGI